jgi:hypothetical protein
MRLYQNNLNAIYGSIVLIAFGLYAGEHRTACSCILFACGSGIIGQMLAEGLGWLEIIRTKPCRCGHWVGNTFQLGLRVGLY